MPIFGSVLCPCPPLETFAHAIAICYRMMDFESAMASKKDPTDPYGASFLTNEATWRGSLHGLRNADFHNSYGLLRRECCVVCQAPVNPTRDALDHVICQEHGGSDASGNILPLCRRCNSSKGTKDLVEWWVWKGLAMTLFDRQMLCLYCRTHWQTWGAQIHYEPLQPWLLAFLTQRAAWLPSEAHRQALWQAALLMCTEDQRQQHEDPISPLRWAVVTAAGPYLSSYGFKAYQGPGK